MRRLLTGIMIASSFAAITIVADAAPFTGSAQASNVHVAVQATTQATTYYQRGVTDIAAKNIRHPCRVFGLAVKADAQFIPAYDARAFTYYLLKQYQSAIADYTVVIQAQPTNIHALWTRGWASTISSSIKAPSPTTRPSSR